MTDMPRLVDGRPLSASLSRLVSFTHEDRAARGLRAFKEGAAEPEAPVYFTAFEMVAMHRAQLLHAPRGGGKTTLAQSIAAALADDEPSALCGPAIRNVEGLLLAQVWDIERPAVHIVWPQDALEAMSDLTAMNDTVLLILDGIEHADDPSALIQSAMGWLDDVPKARLLILCVTDALETLRRHPDLCVHALLPLPAAERQRALDTLNIKDPFAQDWVQPGLWALGLAKGQPLTMQQAAATTADDGWLQVPRDVATLATLPPEDIVAKCTADPRRWLAPLRMLIETLTPEENRPLASALLGSQNPQLLLPAASLITPDSGLVAQLTTALAATMTQGVSPALRRRAGEAIAQLGDPRDLERLVTVDAGQYAMGSDLHPNSAPAHRVNLPAFRIAAFPVTCAAYQTFIDDTGRPWVSANGRASERANHPATDLTWHDAWAYCDWLTVRWRPEGRIAASDIVRLPTEREWEAAARGPTGTTYPWGDDWASDHANDEETGFNDTCTVGLFPEGASAAGCLDMAGQVWEWGTTLWGGDMTTPHFRYPWAMDGREALDAGPTVRRVLRGGCFSSGRAKANAVYRGSLEPSGFWRGNGFRIVVEKREA